MSVKIRLSVGLVSSAIIIYEISLTRLFSFTQHHHYTFLVLSGVICGLGIGAAIAIHIYPKFIRLNSWLETTSGLCAASIFFAALLLVQFPRCPLPAQLSFAIVPVILIGLFLAWTFSFYQRDSQRLYAFDLLGSAFGTLMVVPFIEWLGAPGALLASAAMISFAAFVVRPKLRSFMVSLVFLFMVLMQGVANWIEIDLAEVAKDPNKPMHRAIKSGGKLLESRWSSYARTDLIDRSGDTGLNLYVDGSAGSYMFRFGGDVRKLFFLRREAGFFPYYFGPRNSVLIIGPGGGQDLLYGLMTGWENIDAVEINPEIFSILRNYADYNGHLLDREGVNVYVGDGRRFVERSKQSYDMIALPLVYAEAADLVGYALQENYLFTVEAFSTYLNRLSSDGRLVVLVHNHELMLRVVSTLAHLWEQNGQNTKEMLRHLVIINGTRSDSGVSKAQRPLIMVKKTPYSDQLLWQMDSALKELGLRWYFAQGIKTPAEFVALNAEGIDSFVDIQDVDISPVSDSKPFFYNISSGIDQKLITALWISGLLCVIVLIGPYFSRRVTSNDSEPFHLRYIIFAMGLGLSFMLFEIYLLQRLSFFLGYPALTLVVTLFGLLLGVGIGSMLAEKLEIFRASRGLSKMTIAVGIIIGFYHVPTDLFFQYLRNCSGFERVLFSLFIAFVPGIFLGTLFPSAMRLVESSRSISWMWATNGVASVFGSILAVIILTEWGIELVTGVAGSLYAVSGIVLWNGRLESDTENLSKEKSLSGIFILIFLLITLWFAIFEFVRVRHWSAPQGSPHPRPQFYPEIWPESLSSH